MKSVILTTTLSIIICFNLIAQEQGSINTVRVGKKRNAITYQQNGKTLTDYDLGVILKSKPQSAIEYQKYKTTSMVSKIFA